jgi:hypothetical protein
MSARRQAWARASRVTVVGLAVAVLCSPAGAPSQLVAALAAAAAATLAERLAAGSFGRATLRVSGVWLASAALALAGSTLAHLGASSTALAAALGPAAAMRVSELLFWVSATSPAAFALHFSARRHPVIGVAEGLVVAGCFVGALAAHRNGLISRPFSLGDWSWQLGIDPTLALLAIGGLAALLVVALLVTEEGARRIGVYLAALLVVALALAAVVRLDALPRPDPPGAGQAEESEGSRSAGGGSESSGADRPRPRDDWEFRDDFSSEQNEAPVAVVVLHDDYQPDSGAYYFRQSALSQFNGRRLVQATRDDVDRDLPGHFPAEQVWLAEAPEPGLHRMPMRTTTGLLVDHVRPFALDSPVFFEPSDRGSARFQRSYAALSLVQTTPYQEMLGREAGREDWSGEQWAHYTAAPGDPRYRRLADEIRTRLPEALRDDPLALAFAVKLYLDESGVYSFANRHADAGDPTASFLFGDMTGYCVHFAHAAVFLLRSLGVPARVATGYAVPVRDGYGGSAILIRSLNAHAWPEVQVSGLGWVVVDPVPERSDVATAPPIDPELQRMLGELLRRKEGQIAASDPDAARIRLTAVARWLIAALLAAIAMGHAVRAHRLLSPRFASPKACPRVAYRASLDRLASVGLRRRDGESREAFARRAQAVVPSLAPLTAAHLRAAFGAGAPGDPTPLREMAARVARELRDAMPLWRRALAALDPFAWTRVH